ncbi:NAD(P)H-binding protein [Phytomonospora sp. NPDC050363]|uniref:SDR family oxidoreductase n=1 Tax=Phytomonospora sp. NPDC050363 TaxID=3155642 RepID=UPI00340CDC03
MLLVTGATGTVGRHLVGHLLRAGHPVRALTRNPGDAGLPSQVETVQGDLADIGTLKAAFDGVTAVHLINFEAGYRPLRNGPQIAELASAAGVRRATVLGGWTESTLEPALRESGLDWTHLRPIEFMSNTLADWGPRLRAEGAVREPFGDRRSAPVHESDIAAVAAAALTEDGHAGRAYAITGPEVLTPRDKIRILAEATGRDLAFAELTPEQAREQWTASPPDLLICKVLADVPGMSNDRIVDRLLAMYGDTPEAGRTVTGAVEKVTGRPARTFAQWAAEHADRFTADDAA